MRIKEVITKDKMSSWYLDIYLNSLLKKIYGEQQGEYAFFISGLLSKG